MGEDDRLHVAAEGHIAGPATCRNCGDEKQQHGEGWCNGQHMSGGASGMIQQCGCTAFSN